MTDISKNEAVTHLRQKLPTLKRWAQKENTQKEYHKSINKVLDYINEHLNEKPDLATLSQIANVSPFHFHRIFKAIIGENLGEYVQRLRLEYIAGKLKTTDLSLNILAEKTGYNSEQALSKAFKKHFGTPPSMYKLVSTETRDYSQNQLSPQICEIAPKNIIYIRVIAPYGTKEVYDKAWSELNHFAADNDLLQEPNEWLGISLDDPNTTETNKCRFYACLTIDKPIAPTGKIGCKNIKGGLYAIFTHIGSYSGLNEYYKNIWFGWLPSSGYRLRQATFFEKYVSDPDKVKAEDTVTEIYIPVSLK
ncbi:AraC family transcriptional regulator [Dysgonomonas sp. HDW5B]|nr:AraC family transcriptional regulator [Dysgonomonas sp. HDW5B]